MLRCSYNIKILKAKKKINKKINIECVLKINNFFLFNICFFFKSKLGQDAIKPMPYLPFKPCHKIKEIL